MKVAGIWVCFNCKTQGQPVYDKVEGKVVRVKPGVTMRHLEVRRPGKFGGKGKVVAEANVCQNCYDLGFNKVPVGGFNGYIPAPKELSPEMKKALEIAKEKQRKAEEQLANPVHPSSSSLPSSSGNENKYTKQQEQ
jgi:hypothetical protein